MVKNWFVYLLGLLGVLVFHRYYFGWYSWFVLQLMILLPLFSLLLSLPAMLLAKVRLEVVDHCFRHDAVYVYLRTGSGFLPLPQCRFRLRLSNCMTGESTVLRQKTAGKDHWYVKVDTSHVGMLQCRAERVRVYDYLKLFRIPVRNVRPVRIIIAPVEEEPTRLPNLSRFLVKNLRPKPGGGFSEEHEMRRYRPGDALRDIHWKLSVKTDTLIVREAQEPVHPNVMLSLDLAGTAELFATTVSPSLTSTVVEPSAPWFSAIMYRVADSPLFTMRFSACTEVWTPELVSSSTTFVSWSLTRVLITMSASLP